MELKPYQQQVIQDLELFLERIQQTKDIKAAFQDFWAQHPRSPLQPFPGMAIEPYKNNVPRVPHVCVKVPTAGGKTFIACNALKTIFDAFDHSRPKVVLWLVPSITILEQTLKSLRDAQHPYRQKINSHFGHKVAVLDKESLLQGSGFNVSTVAEQLTIMVFSFDSLRAKNKEDRKVFQENGHLHSFESLLDKGEELSLGAVIRKLNPLVVVDESHNAESSLSVEMLKEVNPCFILDLTATPRKNSNIISFVDALELKRENMVKLPVIVYNHQDKTEVIHSALQLQRRLEGEAMQEARGGGRYIRPIVLFQVQPKNGKAFLNEEEEKNNVQKLKDKLLELNIPAEQIKIKTANINEIKGLDLMSSDCAVRYIITINALKEGWDCPFAYILASLADKSSAVDVEQILGRVLRQPYVVQHRFPMLNFSYVLTASSKFLDTLDNIVKGLNKAGFSDKDFKLAEPPAVQPPVLAPALEDLFKSKPKEEAMETNREETLADDIDVSRLSAWQESAIQPTTAAEDSVLSQIEQLALAQNQALEKIVSDMAATKTAVLPTELQTLVKTYPIKEIFKAKAEALCLPQFFIKVPSMGIFSRGEEEQLLDKENLLEGFALGRADTNISFDTVAAELYKIDLDDTKKEHTPTFVRIDGHAKEAVLAYILDPAQQDKRVKHFTELLLGLIGNLFPIPDKEIRKYIQRVLEEFSDEQFQDLAANQYTYKDKIKQKIIALSEQFAAKRFKELLDMDKIFVRPSFSLPLSIAPSSTAKDLPKSLYEREGSMNGFEERVINELANLPNIAFWTRNLERKGFRINGFINHYPDFILQTKNGKTVIVETKGDHLDAEQKIMLGNLWASKAGNEYRYFMVYEKRQVENSYTLADFLTMLKAL